MGGAWEDWRDSPIANHSASGTASLAPWVKLLYARGCLAGNRAAWLELAAAEPPAGARSWDQPVQRPTPDMVSHTALDATAWRTLYQACLTRLRILERYPSPDWSIADKWVARELLETGAPRTTVAAVLRHGSPGFPRRHAAPEDYPRRTICCAARQIHSSIFPARIATGSQRGSLD
jgi:hypothetical protein